jgi:hypothetical protein
MQVSDYLAGAHRRAGKSGLANVQCGEKRTDVACQYIEAVIAGRATRFPEAATIVGDNAVSLANEWLDLLLPHRSAERKAWDQHDGGAGSVIFIVEIDRGRVLSANRYVCHTCEDSR